MSRLKEEDDETGLASNWNLSALVPALLLRPQGYFQQILLGWSRGLHFSTPRNKTDLFSARLLRSAAAKSHTNARYLFFLYMINVPLKSAWAAQMIPAHNGDSWLIDVRGQADPLKGFYCGSSHSCQKKHSRIAFEILWF